MIIEVTKRNKKTKIQEYFRYNASKIEETEEDIIITVGEKTICFSKSEDFYIDDCINIMEEEYCFSKIGKNYKPWKQGYDPWNNVRHLMHKYYLNRKKRVQEDVAEIVRKLTMGEEEWE